MTIQIIQIVRVRVKVRKEINRREMNILSTSTSIDEEKAQRIALKNWRGLIDRIAQLLQKSSSEQESILSSDLIFYPLWLVGAEVKFSRPFSNPRILYAFLGIDGFFGSVSQAVGHLEAKEIVAEESRVVRCQVTQEEAKTICIRHLKNTYGFKYKKVPEVKVMEVQQVYKPNYVFSCKKGAKEYIRAVEAETGARNYSLDIRFRELSCCDEDRLRSLPV